MSDLNFSKTHDQIKATVLMAQQLGWYVRQDNSGFLLSAPHATKTLHIPSIRQFRDSAMRGWVRTVIHYADPEKRDKMAMAFTAAVGGDIADNDYWGKIEGLVEEGAGGYIDAQQHGAKENPPPKPKAKANDLVVTRRPWMARKSTKASGAELYPSPAVTEVLYNGVVDHYECSVDGCEYVSENPRSVSSHYGGTDDERHVHHKQRTVTAVDPTITEPTHHKGYRPTDRLVRMLAHVFDEIMDNPSYTAEDLAQAALVWAHERPDLPPPEPREPLTAEEKLARISVIVASDEVPVLRGEVDALNQKIAGLSGDLVGLKFARDEWKARAEKAEGDLSALVELVESVRGGK